MATGHRRIMLDRKLFVRTPQFDFEDDGTKFVTYKYKGVIAISRAHGTEDLFLDIRVDTSDKYDWYLTQYYNNAPREEYNKDTFNTICEYIYQKYYLKNFNIARPNIKLRPGQYV